MNGDLNGKNGRSEKSWRYVHYEMNEQERREFERLMESDEGLRREVEQLRQINDRLRELMPLTEQTEETLADQILREWERSTVVSPPNARKKVGVFLLEGVQNLLEAWQWRTRGLRSLATVAATVLLVVGVRAYMAGPLEWARPEIVLGVHYRGGEPEKASGYTRAELLEAHESFRRAVEKYYAAMKTEHPPSWWGRGRKWRLAAKYQELPEGGTQVQVSLYSSRQETLVKEWSHYYPDLRSFGKAVDDLSGRIVKELIASEPEKQ